MAEHDADCACCRMGPEAARKLKQDIRARFPHMVVGTEDFAYSVGLWNHSLPELIVHGIGMRSAMVIINQVAAMMLTTDNVPEDGSIDNDLFSLPTKFRRVSDKTIDYMMCQTVDAERAISAHPMRYRSSGRIGKAGSPTIPTSQPSFTSTCSTRRQSGSRPVGIPPTRVVAWSGPPAW